MKTIDKIINELMDKGLNNFHPSVPLRDIKILKNISNIMTNDSYITESQGNLLVKILKENLEYLDSTELDIANSLKFPTWDKTFRKIEKTRNVSIEEKEKGKFFIKIEFSFDKEIKKVVSLLNRNLLGDITFGTPSIHYYSLFEKNLIVIYDTLKSFKFTFSPEFLELHEKVKNIDTEYFHNKFRFENFYREKEQVINKFETLDSDLVILDRKLRYQYTFDQNFDEKTQNSLEYKIANRNLPKIFIPNSKVSFSNLINAIRNLKRDKILMVFDSYSISECISCLNLFKSINITDSVGIYFRFDNKGEGQTFNKIIADNNFNKQLNDSSKFVGINNGKLPKFLLKNNWYPDAVISFTSGLRSNKTEVYCNDCDLVVYYTATKPLINKCDEIL